MNNEHPAFTDAPSEGEAGRLTTLGRELAQADADITRLEGELAQRKARRNDIAMRELPEYMRQVGQDRIGLPGFDVDLVLEPYYSANIAADWPEDRRQRGFTWLEGHGHGDLIKLVVTYSFRRHQLELARAVVGAIHKLAEDGDADLQGVPGPDIKTSVHPSTLTAFVREQVERGREVDLEALGATVGHVVKLKKRTK